MTSELIILQRSEAIKAMLEIARTMKPDPPDEPLTFQEAAEFLKFSADKLSRLSAAGKIPCRNIGTGAKAKYIYSKNALSRWLAGVD